MEYSKHVDRCAVGEGHGRRISDFRSLIDPLQESRKDRSRMPPQQGALVATRLAFNLDTVWRCGGPLATPIDKSTSRPPRSALTKIA